MFNLIEKLRQKSDRTKKQVAFLSAFFISGTIFVIWLSVIYPAWSDGQQKGKKVAQIEPSPMEGFITNFSTGISGIKEKISKIKDSMSLFRDLNSEFSTSTTATSTVNSEN